MAGQSVVDAALLDAHLEAFINAFIEPAARARWTEQVLRNRHRWGMPKPAPKQLKLVRNAEDVMRAFRCVPERCRQIGDRGALSLDLRSRFGNTPGVHFEVWATPRWLTAELAYDQFVEVDESAVLSIEPGKVALYFCHGGGVFECRR